MECTANLVDALALTGHTCKDLSQKRRDMHQPHLPPKSTGICATHVPMSSEWLYPEGSEFHKSLKEARETRKLGHNMRGQASRRGQSQWHRGNSNAGAFLGCQHWKQGGSYSNRRTHTLSTAFRHLPPNSARFSYATEGALFLLTRSAPPEGSGTNMTVEAT